jgi:hypothetical protein
VAVLLVAAALLAPLSGFTWAVSGGGRASDDADGVGVDSQGRPSVTVLGAFASTVTLGDFRLSGAGGTDFFLARLPAR